MIIKLLKTLNITKSSKIHLKNYYNWNYYYNLKTLNITKNPKIHLWYNSSKNVAKNTPSETSMFQETFLKLFMEEIFLTKRGRSFHNLGAAI